MDGRSRRRRHVGVTDDELRKNDGSQGQEKTGLGLFDPISSLPQDCHPTSQR